MNFDDIFLKYKEASGKIETKSQKPWGLFTIFIITLASSAVLLLVFHLIWVSLLVFVLAVLLTLKIEKIVGNVDRTELENSQFENMKSFLSEKKIYDKSNPLDFSCLDALIQDGERILPRYKIIDSGELIGVFSAFGSALLTLIFGLFHFSEKEIHEQFLYICMFYIFSFFSVALIGISFNSMFGDFFNRNYKLREKFISDLSDFRLKAIINTRIADHKNKKENNTPDRYKRSFIYLAKTKSIHRGTHETRIKH